MFTLGSNSVKSPGRLLVGTHFQGWLVSTLALFDLSTIHLAHYSSSPKTGRQSIKLARRSWEGRLAIGAMSGSKRKERETDVAKRNAPASTVPDPLAINFDDDVAPQAPKWGSDPDALKGPSSKWKVNLVNTTNPTTMEQSNNVCVLHCLPCALKAKQDELTAAINKVAFGGSCTQVSASLACLP